MALVTIPTTKYLNFARYMGNGVLTITSRVINADADYLAVVFKVKEAVTLAKVSIRTATVTTGANLVATVETLSNAGFPSGTLVNANATATIAVNSTDDNVWLGDTAFAGNFALTAGQVVAFVLRRQAASAFDGAIGQMQNLAASDTYIEKFNVAAADSIANRAMMGGLEDSSGLTLPVPNLIPCSTFTQQAFNSGSAANERGLSFTLPMRARVVGFNWSGNCVAGAADANTYQGVLYEGTTQRAITAAVDHDSGNPGTDGHNTEIFTAGYICEPNTEYIIALKPGSTTNVSLNEGTLAAAKWTRALFGDAQTYKGQARADGGAWTPSTTVMPLMTLLIDQVDSGLARIIGG